MVLLRTLPPTDPLIYRFQELVQTYGTTWKALIEEEFGDGIMSAIDFDMKIEREPNPKGSGRVQKACSRQISALQTLLGATIISASGWISVRKDQFRKSKDTRNPPNS